MKIGKDESHYKIWSLERHQVLRVQLGNESLLQVLARSTLVRDGAESSLILDQSSLILDRSSLARLGHHLDIFMNHIIKEINSLLEESSTVIIEVLDITRRMDELEIDFACIAHIRDVVRGFGFQAEELAATFDRTG